MPKERNGGTPKVMKRNKHAKTIAFFFGVMAVGTLLGKGVDGFMASKSIIKGDIYQGDGTEQGVVFAEAVPLEEQAKLPPEDIKEYIKWVFGKHGDEALAIVNCESRFHPNSVGGVGERGLFQVHPIHRKRIERLGYSWDDMFNPYKNVNVAYDIFKEQGWNPWTCKRVLEVN